MNNKKYYYLYMHRNLNNNKVYIGQTCQKPTHRWSNGKGYRNHPYFYNAIQKYGWDNFEHIILQEGLFTQEEINQLEIDYIKKYQSNGKEYGYNQTIGGSIIRIHGDEGSKKWREEHPEEQKAKAIPMLKWQKQNPEKVQENIKKAFLGYKEWKVNNQDKIKEYALKASNASVKKTGKPVRCIETNEEYPSANSAAKNNNLTRPASIQDCCSGKRKTYGGYHWEYINKEEYYKNHE